MLHDRHMLVSQDHEAPLMFAFWGRHGALCEFTLGLAEVAAQSRPRCTFSVSSANELLPHYAFLNGGLFPVETFKRKLSAFTDIPGIHGLRSRLHARLRYDHTRAFVSLMPHVWSPLVAPVIRAAGVRHVAIVHDVDPHPGDQPALLNWWLLKEAAAADRIITLTDWVARRLVDKGVPREKISVLFHPDLDYGCDPVRRHNYDGPLRVLFLGRILAYKGLDLFVDATEALVRSDFPLKAGVFGHGTIARETLNRLSAIGAEVENRWLHHDEFKSILSRYDVVVASHKEASQSGVIATAFGAGLPVIALPTGGLVEQIRPGVNGVVAEATTADALGVAIRRMAEHRAFLAHLQHGIAATREERSMKRFFDEVCAVALTPDASTARGD